MRSTAPQNYPVLSPDVLPVEAGWGKATQWTNMSKQPRRARRSDNNQAAIVKALRQIPGVTVVTEMEDVLVGYTDADGIRRTLWYELKDPATVSPVTGEVRPSAIKESQKRLLREFTGHYRVVWKIDQILDDLGIGESR